MKTHIEGSSDRTDPSNFWDVRAGYTTEELETALAVALCDALCFPCGKPRNLSDGCCFACGATLIAIESDDDFEPLTNMVAPLVLLAPPIPQPFKSTWCVKVICI